MADNLSSYDIIFTELEKKTDGNILTAEDLNNARATFDAIVGDGADLSKLVDDAKAKLLKGQIDAESDKLKEYDAVLPHLRTTKNRLMDVSPKTTE
jgi:hypothetical protein